MTNFSTYSIPINNKVMSPEILANAIKTFLNHKNIGSFNHKYLLIFITLQFSEGTFKSLGKCSKIRDGDIDKYTSAMLKFFNLKDDYYHTFSVQNIIFNFREVEITPDNEEENTQSIIHEPKPAISMEEKHTDIKGFNLPNNMDFLSWGKITINKNTFYSHRCVRKMNKNREYFQPLQIIIFQIRKCKWYTKYYI